MKGSVGVWGSAVCASFALSLGCGELIDESYRGEVLATVSGQVRLPDRVELEADESRNYTMTVLWIGDSTGEVQDRQAFARSGFPATYSLDLFSQPDLDLHYEENGARFAEGYVIVYDDTNQDGRWEVDGERIIGAATDYMLLHVIDGSKSPNYDGPVDTGYVLVEYGACEDDDEVAGKQFRPFEYVSPEAAMGEVSVTVDPIRGFVTPDVNCDGQQDDGCSGFLEFAARVSGAQATDALEDARQCYLREDGFDITSVCATEYGHFEDIVVEDGTPPNERFEDFETLEECIELVNEDD